MGTYRSLNEAAQAISSNVAERLADEMAVPADSRVVDIEEIPGITTLIYIHKADQKHPWHGHRDADRAQGVWDGTNITKYPRGTNIHQPKGPPPIPGEHVGCKCRELVYTTETTISVAAPVVSDNRATIRVTIGVPTDTPNTVSKSTIIERAKKITERHAGQPKPHYSPVAIGSFKDRMRKAIKRIRSTR